MSVYISTPRRVLRMPRGSHNLSTQESCPADMLKILVLLDVAGRNSTMAYHVMLLIRDPQIYILIKYATKNTLSSFS